MMHEDGVGSFGERDEIFRYILRFRVEPLEDARDRMFGSCNELPKLASPSAALERRLR